VALVSLDLLLVRPELRTELLASEAARDLDGLVLVATHTHSGPGGYLPGWLAGRVTGARHDPAVAPQIARAAAAALESAARELAPARAGHVRAELELAENRRRKDGPRERTLELLRLDPERGAPIAFVVYGAHATVLAPHSHALSADWPGALRRWLAQRGWRAVFAQGALGDQQPDPALAPERADPLEVEARELDAVGAAVGEAALPLLESLAMRSGAELAFAEREVDAPEPRPRRGCALWWFSPLARPALKRFAAARVRIQVLRVGDARLVFVPAEPSAEVGEDLRRASASGVVALANDWIGYLVPARDYRRGGYEACMSFAGPGGAEWLVREAAQTARLLGAVP
jgi:hypothetical protein